MVEKRNLLDRAPPARSGGFSLIEVMIVVAIIGILSSIAYPSYVEYVRKSRRVEAITALSRIQQAQERWRSNHTTYASTLADLGITSNMTEHGYYQLSISNPVATGYTASATAAGAQSTDARCASISFTLANGTLTQSASPAANASLCWSRQ